MERSSATAFAVRATWRPARYNLKADYPMVAETYSEARRTMAKSIGFGRKPGQKTEQAADAETTAPKPKRGGKAALDAARQALGNNQ